MSPVDDGFMSRDDRALADRLDRRIDALAGYEVKNFAAGANLKMSAAIDRLETWRRQRKPAWSMSAAVAVAAAGALRADPLFAAQFDGRDHLRIPDAPALGVGLDTGDHARVEVIQAATRMAAHELAARVSAAVAALDPDLAPFEYRPSAPVSAWRNRRRFLRIFGQELVERYDYLVPGLQTRRFDREAVARGHFQIHNLGPRDVQDFKGFLRRPAVACLWSLTTEQRVVPDAVGGYEQVLHLPLVLVYAQELIPVDRACAFLRRVVEGLESPSGLDAGGRE